MKDIVLVLAGGQGLYKTTWCQHLMPACFTQVGKTLELNSFTKSDNIHQITTRVLTELGELDDAFGRSAQGAMKNFFSSPVDEYRRPYMPNAHQWPRMTAFISTVNFLEFLRDVTGARRYLIAHVVSHLANPNEVVDTQQLFAQANAAWEMGETWTLTKAEESMRKESEATYTESTEVMDKMSAYFDSKLEKGNPEDWLPLTWSEIIEVTGISPDKRNTSEISEWLRKKGIERLTSASDKRLLTYPAQKRMCWRVPLSVNDYARYTVEFRDGKVVKMKGQR